MISVVLPDGKKRSLEPGASVADLAASIGPGLARSAVAGKVNGVLVDVSHDLQEGDQVAIITDSSPEGLEVIRHSTAHLLAMALQQEFPGTQITIGPVVENQFYYDVLPPDGVKFSSEDFPRIEARMKALSQKDFPIERKVFSRPDALAYFKNLGEIYKVELIEALPVEQDISLYFMGGWADLCRGPHVPRTGLLSAFKLTSISGAYWRANRENAQLTRIYGTAWAHQKQLQAYLTMLEEAKARDHVVLGRQLGLFASLPEVAPGAPFFLPKGAKLFVLLQNYIRKKTEAFGFQEIITPQVMNVELWKTSGHYEKYREDMYLFESDDAEYGIKPMSCPGHVKLFMTSKHSYRDLPIRYSEFGVVHRNEIRGALHGLTRVRRITQDDGHIFCTLEQVHQEVRGALKLVKEVYADLGFSDLKFNLSTRPEKRIGDDALWDRAERDLAEALEAEGLEATLSPGDGAFYGPKIDVLVRDAIGRWHQCATTQLDFQMPLRFSADYVTSQNTTETPVMIHRAVLGSVERFMGVLIEHCAGHFPVGLSPVQAGIMSVGEGLEAYAEDVFTRLRSRGVRVELDVRNEKLGYKIREMQLAKLPYMVICGKKEAEAGLIQVRHWKGENLAPMSVEDFCELVQKDSGVFWGLDVNQAGAR